MQGASSLVGVVSVEEARRAHAAGADALLLKRELLAAAEKKDEVAKLIDAMKYATSGDE